MRAEAELATQKARVEAIEKSLSIVNKDQAGKPAQPASPAAVEKYQSLAAQLAQLRQSETDLLSRYTAENRLVKVKTAQIAAIEKQRQELEQKNPALIGMAPALASAGSGPARPDILSERAVLVGLQSKLETLRTRVSEIQARANVMEELGPRIEQLEREQELQEVNYEQSRGEPGESPRRRNPGSVQNAEYQCRPNAYRPARRLGETSRNSSFRLRVEVSLPASRSHC